MSSGGFLFDVGLLAVLVTSTAVTACELRRSVLPGWRGAPARLAEAVLGIAIAILLAELVGVLGLFDRWPLVIASMAVAVIAALARRRLADKASRMGDEPPEQRPTRVTAAVAILAVAVALTRSLQAALDALHAGMYSFDTLWYHLPFAARFAQNGSVTRLHYVGNGPTTFYPANGELVHAAGMLLFRSDVLSPVVNVAWLGLALLAGWCVGRPYGVAPATMVATCLVAFLPVLGGAQAGTAGTDVAVLALLVAAVALFVNGMESTAALGIAAVAAGLAAGTKLDAWSSVIALGVLAIVLARGRRVGAGVLWAIGVGALGGLWYVRNLVAVGNPVPWFGARIGGLVSLHATTAPADCGRTSVAHYLFDPRFLSRQLGPQLSPALGARWWLVVGLAALGTGAALCSARRPLRGLAIVALATAAAYLVTPATAGGPGANCFGFNTRFATPALALGLILLPLAVAKVKHGPLLSLLALAFTLGLTVHPSHELAPLAGAGVLLVVAVYVATGARRALPRFARVALVVAVALLVVLGGRHEQQAYARVRYPTTAFSDPVAAIAGRLRDVHHARIAVAGLSENYPLTGADLSNRVDYPAHRDAARYLPYASCRSWLLALRKGHYDYVVTAQEGTADSRFASWTGRYPGARELLASEPGATHRGNPWTWQLFELDPTRRVDPETACASQQ
jgi:hypothetical protein